MKSIKRVSKAIGALVGGAGSAALIWILNSFVLPEPIPAEIEASFLALMATIATYFAPANDAGETSA